MLVNVNAYKVPEFCTISPTTDDDGSDVYNNDGDVDRNSDGDDDELSTDVVTRLQ